MDYQYSNPEGLLPEQRNEQFPHEREELSQLMFQRPFEELDYIEQSKLRSKQSELWLADWQIRFRQTLDNFTLNPTEKKPETIVNRIERKIEEWRQKGHSEQTIQTFTTYFDGPICFALCTIKSTPCPCTAYVTSKHANLATTIRYTMVTVRTNVSNL